MCERENHHKLDNLIYMEDDKSRIKDYLTTECTFLVIDHW